MLIGIGSYTYPWAVGMDGVPLPKNPLTPLALIEKAVSLGVSVVQICDNMPLDHLAASELRLLVATACAAGIRLEIGTRGCQPDHLLRYLALAAQCHSPILRIVLDTADDHPVLEEVVHRLRSVERDFTRAGIRLAIENHDRFHADEFAEIVQRVGPEFTGICLDTVNSFGALEGPDVIVRTLAPWVINLHVKDFAVSRVPSQLGFLIDGRPAGQGRLDIPWLITALGGVQREISAILEQWTPPAAQLEETIVKEDQWAYAGIAYLRTLIPNDR